MSVVDLDEQARDILVANDRGGYTVPTARLYPYQWNWDSAFCALGFAAFDMDRAWREIETLFEGQWPNGMVPHIIFRRDDPDYFPGPSVWGTGATPPSSGHSQPPVAASIVRRLLDLDPGGEARAKALFPGMLAWHSWFHATRDPDGRGVIATTHPWETGRDNAPEWDGAMARIEPVGVPSYTRRDTGHVDPSMRPTEAEYDRYIYMVQWGREHGWNHTRITREGPFAVSDPGLTFVLLRADRDLLALAERFGDALAVSEISRWIAAAEAGCEALWSAPHNAYVARDQRVETDPVPGVSSVAFLAFYAGLGGGPRDEALLGTLDRVLAAAPYSVPSFDPEAPAFDSRRYWRGPVWAVVNYMIGTGLAEAGHSDRAERIRLDTKRLIETSGFFEYFDPTNGAGCGGNAFSWTAAIWLTWAGREG